MYPNDRDCIWTIYADYGKRITFHFATVNIEHHPNCSYDYLKVSIIYAILLAIMYLKTSDFTANQLIMLMQVYDGALEMGRSSELAMYCGLDSETGVPQPITSSSHVASVYFHTDESISGRSDQGISGYMLTWAQVQGELKIYLLNK